MSLFTEVVTHHSLITALIFYIAPCNITHCLDPQVTLSICNLTETHVLFTPFASVRSKVLKCTLKFTFIPRISKSNYFKHTLKPTNL